MTKIEAVTFDLWETLVVDRPDWEQQRRQERCEGLCNVLAQHRMQVELTDVLRAFDESSSWLFETWKAGRQATSIEQVQHILKIASKDSLVLPAEPAVIRMLEDVYRNAALSIPAELDPEAINTLERLRGHGYKIGLICNSGRSPGITLRQLMEKLKILEYFDETIFSDEVGPGKPDKKIFLLTTEKLGVKPAETIHIGDNPESDVHGAKEAGMIAYLLERPVPEEFAKDPKSLFAMTRRPSGVSLRQPDRTIKSLKELLTYLT